MLLKHSKIQKRIGSFSPRKYIFSWNPIDRGGWYKKNEKVKTVYIAQMVHKSDVLWQTREKNTTAVDSCFHINSNLFPSESAENEENSTILFITYGAITVEYIIRSGEKKKNRERKGKIR